jgi:hypothetical protein
MRDNNDAPPSSLIEKIKSQVHDEQIQLAKDLVERKIVPLIQRAIKEDLDYIDIGSHLLKDWKLIDHPQQDDDENYFFYLPTYFQKFEYMLLDENLELTWHENRDYKERNTGQWLDAWDVLYVDRSTEDYFIKSIKSSIILEISW